MSDIDIVKVRNDKNLKPIFYHDKCDKYDYLISVGCGAIAGIIDVFLVGAPGDSMLVSWTDTQVDKVVMTFAKTCGWTPREGKENNVASAIGFLEKKFPVNYDQRHSGDVGNLFNMSAKNHHMKSLAHSPDIIGLFFSVLNQFTSTSSFLSNGQLVTIQTDTYELQGHNFISKLFCGVANWFGHIMSDVAGSSGASGRGSGVVIPFYELFQLCEFGSFQVGKDRNTLATVATKVFQEGYDARFGLAMTIPVVLCDLLIKLVWAIKHYFYHKKPLIECIPTNKHDDLRIMLIIGDGTLCIMDGADAAIRSGGNWVHFFLRLNIIAWYRLVSLVFREVCIQLGISFPLQKQLDAYSRINEALTLYMSELALFDSERFIEETEHCNKMLELLEKAESEEDLNLILKNEYKVLGFELPYSGEFDDFMKDSTSALVFK
ncbi:MAG: hypothetical protein IJN16_04730 [Lachnospiraceae bacterium]|nr:hypothetical protein [Lachnospiraceae bacterium]